MRRLRERPVKTSKEEEQVCWSAWTDQPPAPGAAGSGGDFADAQGTAVG